MIDFVSGLTLGIFAGVAACLLAGAIWGTPK